MRKDKNKSEKIHGRMRAFGNNNERCNVPKPRIELLPFLKPLPEADGRQQGVNKLTPQKGLAEMVETCKDCPECQTIKRGHQNNDTLQNVNKC